MAALAQEVTVFRLVKNTLASFCFTLAYVDTFFSSAWKHEFYLYAIVFDHSPLFAAAYV